MAIEDYFTKTLSVKNDNVTFMIPAKGLKHSLLVRKGAKLSIPATNGLFNFQIKLEVVEDSQADEIGNCNLLVKEIYL